MSSHQINKRLSIALMKGDMGMAEALIKKGGANPDADIGMGDGQFLSNAIKTTDLNTVRFLIDNGANPDGFHTLSIFLLLMYADLWSCSTFNTENLLIGKQFRKGEITSRQCSVRLGKLKRRYEEKDFQRIKIGIAKILIDAGAKVNHFIHPIERAVTDEDPSINMGLAWFLMLHSEIDWSLVSKKVRNGDTLKNWIKFVEIIRNSNAFKHEGISCLYEPCNLVTRLHPGLRDLRVRWKIAED